MTADLVDDLHAAEDHIELLTVVLEALTVRVNRTALNRSDPLRRVHADAVRVLERRWCRPSCGDCGEDCGCPGHPDETPPHRPKERL